MRGEGGEVRKEGQEEEDMAAAMILQVGHLNCMQCNQPQHDCNLSLTM